MDSLKNLTDIPSKNIEGEISWDSKVTSDSWIESNGGVLSQASYPKLFSEVGLILDGDYEDNWVVSSLSATNIVDVVYGNGMYIYAGSVGKIGTSTNAINWTTRNSSTTRDIDTLAYGNGVFIYGASDASYTYLGYTSDGINWNTIYDPTNEVIMDTIYNSDDSIFLYLNTGAGGTVIKSSTNGANWSIKGYAPGFDMLMKISYNDGVYFATGEYETAGTQGYLYTSTNAANWIRQYTGSTSTVNALLYANGIYLYSTNGGVLKRSTDHTNWTTITYGSTSTIYSLFYSQEYNIYMMGGSGGMIKTSTDAINWTARISGTTSIIYSLSENENRFIGGGGSTGFAVSIPPYSYNTSTDFKLPDQIQILNQKTHNYIKGD